MANDGIVKLHHEYMQHVGGDTTAAAMLVLAERLGQVAPEKLAQSDVLTVAEAAKAMKTSGKLVYALCASGRLRHQRIGTGRGMIRIQRADLAKIIAESTHEVDDGLALFRRHAVKPNARRARRQEPA